MKNWKLVLVVVLAVLVVVVVLQNTDPATTRVLWVTVEMPRALLLLLTLGVGGLAGFLLGVRRRRREGPPEA